MIGKKDSRWAVGVSKCHDEGESKNGGERGVGEFKSFLQRERERGVGVREGEEKGVLFMCYCTTYVH